MPRTGRPRVYSDDDERRREMALRQRTRRAVEAGTDVAEPTEAEIAAAEPLPEVSPAQIAMAMRHVGLRAVEFARRTMEDQTVETKHRLAAASLLVSRRWLDAPSDPSILLQQNTVVFDAARADTVLDRLKAMA